MTEEQIENWAREKANALEENQTLGIYDRDEDMQYDEGYNDGQVSGYEEGLIDGYHECQKEHEWHKADIPTSPINKVVLGYIKDYNSKKFCLVKWNGEWWYDARTWNDKVKLIAWKEIVLPKEIE